MNSDDGKENADLITLEVLPNEGERLGSIYDTDDESFCGCFNQCIRYLQENTRAQIVVIIMIGLGIGAMFVRSLTVMMVEKKVLKQFLYLEHGAHWAIGALSLIMLVSTRYEVPEVVTGLIGLIFILGAFYSSVKHNKLNG